MTSLIKFPGLGIFSYHFFGICRRAFDAQDLGGRGVRGITISRRPNSRASSESAPGPIKTMAAAAATANAALRFASKELRDRELKNGRTPLHRPMIAAASGVRNPIKTNRPLPIASTPAAHAIAVRSLLADRNTAPCTIANTPNVVRNRRSPTPGHPPGNVEKSLCSSILLLVFLIFFEIRNINDTCDTPQVKSLEVGVC